MQFITSSNLGVGFISDLFNKKVNYLIIYRFLTAEQVACIMQLKNSKGDKT
jgi:hypothetical protein